jgi:hypothetical protein
MSTARSHNVPALIQTLVSEERDGTPQLVLVDNYLKRQDLAEALRREVAVYGLEAMSYQNRQQADEGLPALVPERHVAIALVDSGKGHDWGEYLSANREQLPRWVRFLIVLVMPPDLPALATPAFFSWAKGSPLIERLAIEPPTAEIPALEAELAAMQRETGLTPSEYIAAWRRGDLPDTHRHAAWLNLAYAVTREGD